MGARRKVKPPRVVFDTNIVLSSLLFSNGRLAILRGMWREGRAVPLVCKATVEELLRVLAYPKFRLTPEDRENLLADYLPFCEIVTLPNPLPTVPDCRDPNDTVFLQLASAAKADCLVTGDGDLLAVAGSFSIPIVGGEDFVKRGGG